MTPPAGNYLAHVRKGTIQFPPPFVRYCAVQNWTRFQILTLDHDHLVLQPDSDSELELSVDGKLVLPGEVLSATSLGEQSVMLRIDMGLIHVAIRKVFETLGFRPD